VHHPVRLLFAILLGLSCACGSAPRPIITTEPVPTATSTQTPTTSHAAPALPAPGGLVDIDPSIPVSLRYATADNFTGAPLPGYEANRGLLRPAAAAALLRAQHALVAHGASLLVLDAYRPVRATNAMVAWAHRMHRDDLIGPYIAARSEHNLGEAVDVTLRGRDMGSAFDSFSSSAHYSALPNQKVLRDAMIAAGFHPYDEEWWHFSVTIPGATALDVPITSGAALRLPAVGSSTQAIVVRTPSWNATVGSLTAYEKTDGTWHAIAGTTTAYVGYSGFSTHKHEGDGRTPAGIYGFAFAFGTESDPGTKLTYRRTTSSDVWVDDPESSLYNLWERGPSRGRWKSAEQLYQPKPYAYAAAIAYNTARTPGRGSAIFLHVSLGHATSGCVSIERSTLVRILRWLDPAQQPVIVMGPSSYVDSL